MQATEACMGHPGSVLVREKMQVPPLRAQQRRAPVGMTAVVSFPAGAPVGMTAVSFRC